MFYTVLYLTNTVSTHTYTRKFKFVCPSGTVPAIVRVRSMLLNQYITWPECARPRALRMPKFVFYFYFRLYVSPLTSKLWDSHTLPMLLGQHNPSSKNVWELGISANASPYGFLHFLINCTLNMSGARGLAHSECQKNRKNGTSTNTELHNTKKAVYFTTTKITFIKHPKK